MAVSYTGVKWFTGLTSVTLLVGCVVVPLRAQPAIDRVGIALRLVKEMFPDLARDRRVEFHAVLTGNYSTALLGSLSFIVAPSSDIGDAIRINNARDLYRIPLRAVFRFNETGDVETIFFQGIAVRAVENAEFGRQVDANKDWKQSDVLRKLSELGARCTTETAVTTKLPLELWQPIMGTLKVRSVAFDDPAARREPGDTPRGDPYDWRVELDSSLSPRHLYVILVEPLGCGVRAIVRSPLPPRG